MGRYTCRFFICRYIFKLHLIPLHLFLYNCLWYAQFAIYNLQYLSFNLQRAKVYNIRKSPFIQWLKRLLNLNTDDNECTSRTHNCDLKTSICQNTVGKYRCVCRNGYKESAGKCTGMCLVWYIHRLCDEREREREYFFLLMQHFASCQQDMS